MEKIDKTTALYDKHLSLGGRIVSFAGWKLPVFYSSIVEEHMAVRTQAGVFDISHMGQLAIEGPGAGAWLNNILTNNVLALEEGQGQYTLLLNEQGGVVDDLIVYRTAPESYFLVVNASRDDEVFLILSRLNDLEHLSLRRMSEEYSGFAVQGPSSPEVFTRISGGLTLPPRFGVDTFELDGQEVIACRTGYTGEDGFEFFVPNASAEKWFAAILDSGVVPCGLGARDSLRLEVAYPLNGNDLMRDKTPLQAGLQFAVALEKETFIGSEVLKKEASEGIPERLVGIKAEGKTPPFRAGYEVRLAATGEPLGTLTSGVLSPCLNASIGLAYLPAAHRKNGTFLEVGVRKNWFPAHVVPKPIYKR